VVSKMPRGASLRHKIGLGTRAGSIFEASSMVFWIALAVLMGCTPTVQVAADKPITINLNVKIDHEVRVKVDRELDKVISEKSPLY
jgi:hypothetical protein